MKKSAFIECNSDFIDIYTMSRCSVSHKDPLGDEFFFSIDEQLEVLGHALTSALQKSRDLSSSPEEREEVNDPRRKHIRSFRS
jgi:transcription elongation factor GreA-like protein